MSIYSVIAIFKLERKNAIARYGNNITFTLLKIEKTLKGVYFDIISKSIRNLYIVNYIFKVEVHDEKKPIILQNSKNTQQQELSKEYRESAEKSATSIF